MRTTTMTLECPWCKTTRRVNVTPDLPRMLYDCKRCHSVVEVKPLREVPDGFLWLQSWAFNPQHEGLKK